MQDNVYNVYMWAFWGGCVYVGDSTNLAATKYTCLLNASLAKCDPGRRETVQIGQFTKWIEDIEKPRGWRNR